MARARGSWFASAALTVALSASLFAGSSALAGHLSGWTHDHTSKGVPPRPSGLSGLNAVFGPRCSDRADNARSWWPFADTDPFGAGKYVEYHTYLARNIGYNVRNHVAQPHRDVALYPGIGGYVCRQIAGSTSWSTHSWGAAIDTNWQRNPRGQRHWNGRGWDDRDYGTFLPDIWRGGFPGHRFFWGLAWDNAPDPMHFQYVTDY